MCELWALHRSIPERLRYTPAVGTRVYPCMNYRGMSRRFAVSLRGPQSPGSDGSKDCPIGTGVARAQSAPQHPEPFLAALWAPFISEFPDHHGPQKNNYRKNYELIWCFLHKTTQLKIEEAQNRSLGASSRHLAPRALNFGDYNLLSPPTRVPVSPA